MNHFLAQVFFVVAIGVLVVTISAPLSSCQGGAKSGATDRLIIADGCAHAVASYSGDAIKVTLSIDGKLYKVGFKRVDELRFTLEPGSGAALHLDGADAELGDCSRLCPAVEGAEQCVRARLKSSDEWSDNACLKRAKGVVCGAAP